MKRSMYSPVSNNWSGMIREIPPKICLFHPPHSLNLNHFPPTPAIILWLIHSAEFSINIREIRISAPPCMFILGNITPTPFMIPILFIYHPTPFIIPTPQSFESQEYRRHLLYISRNMILQPFLFTFSAISPQRTEDLICCKGTIPVRYRGNSF